MKTIESFQTVDIHPKCKVSISSRVVTVTGPRGTITKSFKHVNCEITKVGNQVKVGVWFGNRKHIACVRTVCSHINNMITGVVKGFQYKMRFVYAHFPINVNIPDSKDTVEIRNFIGEKTTRVIKLLPGVTVATGKQKDEIVLSGNDIENVSQSAATIQQSTCVKGKDIRKFLDGIYVSERGNVVSSDE